MEEDFVGAYAADYPVIFLAKRTFLTLLFNLTFTFYLHMLYI